jgi:hypothetical protein
MAWETAGSIINDAAVECGLPESSDPFNGQDPNYSQLARLFKSCGREMVHLKNWTHLRKEHLFTTVQGVSAYVLPDDFHNMYDQTWWNRTNRLPLGGPLSPQEWQFLKSRLAGVVFTVLFRPMEGQIVLYPDTNTPGGYDIAFEYHSSYWTTPIGQFGTYGSTPSSDTVTASTDRVFFDPLLMTKMLKWKFLAAKGFDTTAAQQEFTAMLDAVKGHDTPSPILSLNRNRGLRIDPLLGQQNVPITNFG